MKGRMCVCVLYVCVCFVCMCWPKKNQNLNISRTASVWNTTSLQPNCMNLPYRKALFFNKSLQNSLCPVITLMFLYYSEMPKPQINLISGFTVNVLCSLRNSDDRSGLYQSFIPNDCSLWRTQFCQERTVLLVKSHCVLWESFEHVSAAACLEHTYTQLCHKGEQRAANPFQYCSKSLKPS